MSTKTKIEDGDTVNASSASKWSDSSYLEELHVERGWSGSDIAREHDIEPERVRDRLKEIEIFQGQTHPPKSGLARKLWERGIGDQDGGDELDGSSH